MPISQRAVVATARAGAFSMRSAAEQSVESIMHLLAMLAVACVVAAFLEAAL